MDQKQTILNKRYFFLVCFIAALGGFLFGFDTAVISGVLEFVSKDFHFSLLMHYDIRLSGDFAHRYLTPV